MEKRNIVLIAVAIVSVLIIAGVAAAQGMWRNNANPQGAKGNWQGMGMMHGGMMQGMMAGMAQHHEDMDKVFEGTYADLVKYREDQGFNVMPWVQNEEDFKLAKQMHEKMEKWHEENGGKGAGCPMMSEWS